MATVPRVDAYIQKAQPFARPLLAELRARIHGAVKGLDETASRGLPTSSPPGASIAGFKAHVKLNLWKADFKSAMPEAIDAGTLDELPTRAELAKKLKASAATFKPAPAPKKKAPAKKKR